MWTCPECGRSYAQQGQTHVCTDRTVEDFLAGVTPEAAALYHAFAERMRVAGGPYRVHAVATRVAFITRMTFAGATFAKRWIDIGFILPAWEDDLRFDRIDLYQPTAWGHRLRLRSADELDAAVDRWCAMSWRRGEQEAFDPAPVVPISTRATGDRLRCTFRGKCVDLWSPGGPAGGASPRKGRVALPAFLVDALGERAELVVRGHGRESTQRPDEAWTVSVVSTTPVVDVSVRRRGPG